MRWLGLPAVVLSAALIASSQTTSTTPADLAQPPASSQSASTAPANLDTLKAKAEAVMKLGRVSQRPQEAAVFQYANALSQAGQDEEATKWYEKGLQIHAWALQYQLKYAQLLMKQGNEGLAVERAKLVAENAEQGDLVVAAMHLLGEESQADVSLPPLHTLSQTESVVVLFPLGDVDTLLLKQVHKQLQASLPFPVYLCRVDVELPPPGPDPYRKFLDQLRSGLLTRPDTPKLLAQQGLTIEDVKDDEKMLAFIRNVIWSRDGAAVLKRFDAMCQSVKSEERQWMASDLVTVVKEIGQRSICPYTCFVGITPMDITEPDANYLFALQHGHYGVVSYRQFMADKYGEAVPKRARLADRLVKQCTSSIGREFGIDPCSNPTCVAAYPNSLAELDAKTNAFCPICKKKLEERLAQEKKG